MPIVVHITDEKRAAAILRSGIRLPRETKAVYFMPMTQSHLISHQWIRELRRRGAKVLVGVYIRIAGSEQVWAGKYNQPHRSIPLSEAIRELRSMDDPLGYEVFVNRAISASEIQKVRAVPQGVGWRYLPHAHGKTLCGCPVCIPKGSIKSTRLRERLEPDVKVPSLLEVKAKLLGALDPDDVTDWLWALRRKRRRADPAFLEPLLSSGSPSVLEDVALTLPYFRHPDSTRMLEVLARNNDSNVSTAAAEGLRAVYERRGAMQNET